MKEVNKKKKQQQQQVESRIPPVYLITQFGSLNHVTFITIVQFYQFGCIPFVVRCNDNVECINASAKGSYR